MPLYFTKARREIQSRIQLRLGEESAKLRHQQNSLVNIVNAALGGETPKAGPPRKENDVTAGAATPEAAVALINNMLKF